MGVRRGESGGGGTSAKSDTVQMTSSSVAVHTADFAKALNKMDGWCFKAPETSADVSPP